MPGGTSPLEYAGGSAAKWLSEEDEEGEVVTVGPGKGGGLGSSSRNKIMGDMAEGGLRRQVVGRQIQWQTLKGRRKEEGGPEGAVGQGSRLVRDRGCGRTDDRRRPTEAVHKSAEPGWALMETAGEKPLKGGTACLCR